MKLNTTRVWLGGFAGGIVWTGVEFLHRNAARPLLRGDAEARIVFERTAISILRRSVDSADFRNVDSSRLSLCVESRDSRTRAEDRTQNRNDRRLLCGRTRQFCASVLVSCSPRAATRMDARFMGWVHPRHTGRGIPVQGSKLDLERKGSGGLSFVQLPRFSKVSRVI